METGAVVYQVQPDYHTGRQHYHQEEPHPQSHPYSYSQAPNGHPHPYPYLYPPPYPYRTSGPGSPEGESHHLPHQQTDSATPSPVDHGAGSVDALRSSSRSNTSISFSASASISPPTGATSGKDLDMPSVPLHPQHGHEQGQPGSLPLQSPGYYTDLRLPGGSPVGLKHPHDPSAYYASLPNPEALPHPHHLPPHPYSSMHGHPQPHLREPMMGYGAIPTNPRSPPNPYGPHPTHPHHQILSQAPPPPPTAGHMSYPYQPAVPSGASGSYYDTEASRARSVSQPAISRIRTIVEEGQTRRGRQDRLAQQELRRRRMEHAQYLEQKVVELTSQLEAQTGRSVMLEDLCQRLQMDNQNLRAAVSALKGEQPTPVVPAHQQLPMHTQPASYGSKVLASPPGSATLAINGSASQPNPFAYERPSTSHLHPVSKGQLLAPPAFLERRMSVISSMDDSVGSSSGASSSYGSHLGGPVGPTAVKERTASGRTIST